MDYSIIFKRIYHMGDRTDDQGEFPISEIIEVNPNLGGFRTIDLPFYTPLVDVREEAIIQLTTLGVVDGKHTLAINDIEIDGGIPGGFVSNSEQNRRHSSWTTSTIIIPPNTLGRNRNEFSVAVSAQFGRQDNFLMKSALVFFKTGRPTVSVPIDFPDDRVLDHRF